MDKNRKKLMSAFMIMLVIAALAVAGYYIINKQITQKAQDEVNLPDTEVGKLLAKDLDVAYPETPTEVVKLYWRLNQCMYNESMDDKEFEGLLKQLRKLFTRDGKFEMSGEDFAEYEERYLSDSHVFEC